MNKNLLFAFSTIATLIVSGVVIVSAVLYFQSGTVSASSVQPEAVVQAQQVAVNVIVPTNTPAAIMNYPLTQTIRGVKLTVNGTSIEGQYFAVDVCYNFPTQDGSWMVGGEPEYITLSSSQGKIGVYGITIIGDLSSDAAGKPLGRCDQLRFPITPDTKLDQFTLTIQRIATTPAEILDCAKAQQKLDATNQNIQVKCFDGTNHIGGFQVVSKPANMEDAAASNIASEAFIDIVNGPWVFNLSGQ